MIFIILGGVVLVGAAVFAGVTIYAESVLRSYPNI